MQLFPLFQIFAGLLLASLDKKTKKRMFFKDKYQIDAESTHWRGLKVEVYHGGSYFWVGGEYGNRKRALLLGCGNALLFEIMW